MKQFDSVMTEHERRVNDADIRAYQNQDLTNIYHKSPGYHKYGELQSERYTDNAFGKTMNASQSMPKLNITPQHERQPSNNRIGT